MKLLNENKQSLIGMDPVGSWPAYTSPFNSLSGTNVDTSGFLHPSIGNNGRSCQNPSNLSSSQHMSLLPETATSFNVNSVNGPTFNSGFIPSSPSESIFTAPAFPTNYKSHNVISNLPLQQSLSPQKNNVQPVPSKVTHPYIPSLDNAFYNDQTSTLSPLTTSWSRESNELNSPFGVLPHESVTPNVPNPIIPSEVIFDNTYSGNLAASQPLDIYSSQAISTPRNYSSENGENTNCNSPQVALQETVSLPVNSSSLNNLSIYQQANPFAALYNPENNTNGNLHHPIADSTSSSSITSSIIGIDHPSPGTNVFSSSNSGFIPSNFDNHLNSLSPHASKFQMKKRQIKPNVKEVGKSKSASKRRNKTSKLEQSSLTKALPVLGLPNQNIEASNLSSLASSEVSLNSGFNVLNVQHSNYRINEFQNINGSYQPYSSPDIYSERNFSESRNKSASISSDSAYSTSSPLNVSDCSVNSAKKLSPSTNQVSPLNHISSPAYSFYSNSISSLSSPLPNQIQPTNPQSCYHDGSFAPLTTSTVISEKLAPKPISSNLLDSSITCPVFDSLEKNNVNYRWDMNNIQNSVTVSNSISAPQITAQVPVLTDKDPALNYPNSLVSYQNLHQNQNAYQPVVPINGDKFSNQFSCVNKKSLPKNSSIKTSIVADKKPKSSKQKKNAQKSSKKDLKKSVPSEEPHPYQSNQRLSNVMNDQYPKMSLVDKWNSLESRVLNANSKFLPSFQSLPETSNQPVVSFHSAVPSSSSLPSFSSLKNDSVVLPNSLQENAAKTDLESSKVIVPDVEDELSFLADGLVKASNFCGLNNLTPVRTDNNITKSETENEKFVTSLAEKSIIPENKLTTKVSSGFIGSYLKFLQGDKETHPPVCQQIPKMPKYYPPETKSSVPACTPEDKNSSTNPPSTSTSLTTIPNKPKNSKKSSLSPPPIDSEDDLRYYPLPKSRDLFNTSSDNSDTESLVETASKPINKTCVNLQTSAKNLKRNKRKMLKPLRKKKSRKASKTARKSESESSDESKSNEPSDSEKSIPEVKSEESQFVSNCSADQEVKIKPLSIKLILKDFRNELACKEKIDTNENIKDQAKLEENSMKAPEEDCSTMFPRRETANRKAKEKTNVILALRDEDYDFEEPIQDSDYETVWTPEPKKEELSKKEEGNRLRSRSKLKLSVNLAMKKSKFFEGSSDNDSDRKVYSKRRKKSQRIVRKKFTFRHKKSKSMKKRGLPERKISAVNPPRNYRKFKEPVLKETVSETDHLFSDGDFVINKADISLDYPPLWRAEGKLLLQKYESFEKNGEFLHRSTSTFSGWTSSCKNNYEPITVNFHQADRFDTVVKYLRPTGKYTASNMKIIEELMKETEKFQDNFEIYIQTLISQALDSNFLNEILTEKDEYFLNNVDLIDQNTLTKADKLNKLLGWKDDLIASVQTYPCYSESLKMQASKKRIVCRGCASKSTMFQIMLFGQPYNNITLEGAPPSEKAIKNKDFYLCQDCDGKFHILNRVSHQKYQMFMESSKQVLNQKHKGGAKDTARILNELLANEEWLNELFIRVRKTWAEIDFMEIKIEESDLSMC